MSYELQNSIAVLYELLGLRPNMNYGLPAICDLLLLRNGFHSSAHFVWSE